LPLENSALFWQKSPFFLREERISFRTAPIFDASGRQAGAVSTITDITEVRDLQDRLED
jgi:hypothetical protein